NPRRRGDEQESSMKPDQLPPEKLLKEQQALQLKAATFCLLLGDRCAAAGDPEGARQVFESIVQLFRAWPFVPEDQRRMCSGVIGQYRPPHDPARQADALRAAILTIVPAAPSLRPPAGTEGEQVGDYLAMAQYLDVLMQRVRYPRGSFEVM